MGFFFISWYKTILVASGETLDCMTGGYSVKGSCFLDGPRAYVWDRLGAPYMEHTEGKTMAGGLFSPSTFKRTRVCSSISNISPGQPGNQSPGEA